MKQKQPTPNREQSNLLELPRCEGEEPKVNESIIPLRKYIAIGYAVIALLIGGIVFIYLHEWRELERIEAESKEMNMLRQKVHDAYAQMLDRQTRKTYILFCDFVPFFA